jgi:hypothetical protein
VILTATVLFVLAEILIGVVLIFLPWSRIKGWFTNHESVINADEENLRVTLHEKLGNGQHRVVYGIFNKSTSQFVDGEVAVTEQIDDEIAAFHKDAPLVVYT